MIRLETFRTTDSANEGGPRGYIACLEFASLDPETKKRSITACMNFFG
jgi:hypothetical protein